MLYKAKCICVNQLRYAFSTSRVPLVIIVNIIFLLTYIEPVCQFATDISERISGYYIVFIFDDIVCQLILVASVVFIFSDAPFIRQNTPYLITRCGRTAWVIGNCIYIICLSGIFIALLCIFSVIPIISRISLQNNWGKVWGTLARTSAAQVYSLPFSVNDLIIGNHKPLGAFLIGCMQEWLCFVFVGLSIYFINDASCSHLGCIFGAFLTFLDITVENELPFSFFRFSPVTMARLSCLSSANSIYKITQTYAICFLIIGNFILFGMCIGLYHSHRYYRRF